MLTNDTMEVTEDLAKMIQHFRELCQREIASITIDYNTDYCSKVGLEFVTEFAALEPLLDSLNFSRNKSEVLEYMSSSDQFVRKVLPDEYYASIQRCNELAVNINKLHHHIGKDLCDLFMIFNKKLVDIKNLPQPQIIDPVVLNEQNSKALKIMKRMHDKVKAVDQLCKGQLTIVQNLDPASRKEPEEIRKSTKGKQTRNTTAGKSLNVDSNSYLQESTSKPSVDEDMQDQDKSSKSNRRSNKKAVASGDGSIIQSPIGSPDDKEPLSPKQTKKRGGGRPPNANKTSSTKQTPGKSDSSPLKRVGSRNRKTMDQGTIAEMNAGPTEPRYCYCHRVSFGDMIGCDNDDCSLEWFHFKCVDIKIKPKGKWYCPDCRSSPETANLRNPNITTPNITTSANTPS